MKERWHVHHEIRQVLLTRSLM